MASRNSLYRFSVKPKSRNEKGPYLKNCPLYIAAILWKILNEKRFCIYYLVSCHNRPTLKDFRTIECNSNNRYNEVGHLMHYPLLIWIAFDATKFRRMTDRPILFDFTAVEINGMPFQKIFKYFTSHAIAPLEPCKLSWTLWILEKPDREIVS